MGKLTTCSVEGCDRAKVARGWCRPHWKRWSRHGDPTGGGAPRFRNRICSVEGCESKHEAQGYCNAHYARVQRCGDPLPDIPLGTRIPRTGTCTQGDCSSETFCRGLCWSHYYREWRYGDATAGLPIYEDFSGKPCANEGCAKDSRRRGYCNAHYLRLLKGTLGIEQVPCVQCGTPIVLAVTEAHGRRRRPVHISRCDSCKRPTNPTTVAALLVRDGDSCAICSKPVDMSLAYPDQMSPSVDHVIPLSVGGPNTPENCALAHLGCNIKKRARAGWTISA